jgi:hypothetical protein
MKPWSSRHRKYLISCGRTVIEYLLEEGMRAERLIPDRIEWLKKPFPARTYRLKVWVEDLLFIEFFLEDELVFCFSIPEYYRSVESKLSVLIREMREKMGAPDDPEPESARLETAAADPWFTVRAFCAPSTPPACTAPEA